MSVAAHLCGGLVGALVLTAAVGPAPAVAAPGEITRVSVDSQGRQGSDDSYAPAISADGRFVAFDSEAPDLIGRDTNRAPDVFVRDRRTGRTTRVSVAGTGTEGNRGSYTPAISGDGRWVAFVSEATNLVPGDTNGDPDVFLHDRRTKRTVRLSVATDGRETTGGTSPVISRNGRYVVYNVGTPLRSVGDDSDLAGMFLYDTRTGKRTRLPGVAGVDPSISADGRYVAFSSEVRDLVPGDTNHVFDCFVLDRRTGRISRVSVGPKGRQGNGESSGAVISANGRYVAFASTASNLVRGDTNRVDDVFVRDLRAGTTRRVSVRPGGGQADGISGGPVLSASGRYLLFLSAAGNLVRADRGGADFHIYRADLRTGALVRVTSSPTGRPANAESTSFPALSADGRTVAFGSRASNLVRGDTNGRDDIFVREFSRPPARTGGVASVESSAPTADSPDATSVPRRMGI
ncbi:TolB family protein [Sporichthya polymorpha]|uniref:TolB family protein n=1 Tax=Sporichthya polymorpha TaxID=35751 RepID=UPI000367E931|nr:PD40 domain-containing protein [Sporichthya polymorpha]